MKKSFGFITVIINVYLLTGLALFFLQRDFIYYPTKSIEMGFQIEFFQNQGERIEVVVLNREKENAILYFGGNGEAVVFNAPEFQKTFPEQAVYLVNYRGYSQSSGEPSEDAIYSDALHIYAELQKRHPNINVIGRSLGSGVATYLASKYEVNKLVLVTPYDSIVRIAQDAIPLYPMALLLSDQYNSASRVKNINSEVLVLIAENDKVIPYKYSMGLIEAFNRKRLTVEILKGVGHNDISVNLRYHQLMKSFLEKQ